VLAQGGAFGLLLRLVQQRRTPLPVFEQTLREVVSVLERLGDKDRERWLELLSYIAALLYHERRSRSGKRSWKRWRTPYRTMLAVRRFLTWARQSQKI
jgi:hypothetical protein